MNIWASGLLEGKTTSYDIIYCHPPPPPPPAPPPPPRFFLIMPIRYAEMFRTYAMKWENFIPRGIPSNRWSGNPTYVLGLKRTPVILLTFERSASNISSKTEMASSAGNLLI